MLGLSAGERGSLGLFGSALSTNPTYRSGFAIGSAEETVRLVRDLKNGMTEHTRVIGEHLERLAGVVEYGNSEIASRLDAMIDQLDEQTRLRRVENNLTDVDRYVSTRLAPPVDWYPQLTGAQLRQ